MNAAYTLTSATARATFAAHGAELTSLVKNDIEYLWQADPAVWGRHAPVLFPIVGRLPEDTYLHNGQPYKLTQHGFARDREFAVVGQTDAQIVFRLADDAASRAVFPFAFELTISYTLLGDELEMRWQVRNPAADAELLFSIGAHPAFCCPLLPDETFADYFFDFDQPVTAGRYLLSGGLLSGETAPLLQNQATLPLSYELFADDALVLKHYDFSRLTLRSHTSPHFVEARFEGFPYLGLWTKGPDAPFVCIEPWQGIASSVGQPQELRHKEGIISLQPGRVFEAAYQLRIG